MAKAVFNQEVKDVLDSFLLENVEVEPGKAFGCPAYYINGKMFACVYEDGVSLKVPEQLAKELIGREGIEEFRPMKDRVMKQWVLLKRDNPSAYLEDGELFRTSLDFVYHESKKKKA